MKITGDKSDLSISQAGAGTATRQCEDPTKLLPITQRPGPLENMDGSHNGEPPPPGTEDAPEGFALLTQNEESSQTVMQTEETEPKPMEILTQNLEVEKESGSIDLKTADLSSDDEVKKDSSKKKSKKHKKHKSKKKKKKKKKEKNEKRSKSTSSGEEKENASSESKSAWKPVTSSPKEQDKLNRLSSQTEQNVDALPSLGEQDDDVDSVKEHPAKPQLDTDSGFFGPKCPSEMHFSVCSNKPTVCEVEMQEPSKEFNVDCQQNNENVKCTDQSIENQPENCGTAEVLQNEMSLPHPGLVLSEGIGVELGASRLNSEGSKDFLKQSVDMSSLLLQPASKINSASLSKSTAKLRSRSKSLARDVRSRSKSLTKVPKKQAYSKSLTRQRSRSSSMVRRQRSRSSSIGQRRRSKSPVRRRRSRSRTPVRYSKSPIRSWWSKSIKNRQRSVSIERRRRSRTRSLAKRRRSRSRSSEKGHHSKTSSSAKRISSRSRSANRRKSRSPSRKQRLRSSSASKRKSKSAIRTTSKSRSPSRRQKSKSVSPLMRQKSKTSSPVRRRRSRSGAASRRHRSRSGSGSRRRKSRSGSFTRRGRSGSVPRRGRSRSSLNSRRRKSRSISAFRRRRSRSAVASRSQKSRSPSAPRRRRRSRSPSVSRRRKTRSPSISRRRRTRSPSVSRRLRTRSPSFSRRRRTRSPSFSRRRRTRSPSVPRRRRTRSPSVSRRRRSRSPSISRRRISRSASASRRRRSQSASRRQKSRSGSNTRRPRSRSGSIIQRQKSQSYSAINRKSTSVAREEQSTLLSNASKVQSGADKLSSSLERRSRSKEKDQKSRSRAGFSISKSISVESEPILQSKSSTAQKKPGTLSLDEKLLYISASTVESFDPNLSTVEKHSENKLPDGSSTSLTELKSDSYCDNAIYVESSTVLAAHNILGCSSTTSVLDDHMKSTYSKCPTEEIISSDLPFNENGSTECDMDIDEISSPTQADYIELPAANLHLFETSKEEYELQKTNNHTEWHTKVVDIRIHDEPEQKTLGISAENRTVCKPFGRSSDFELTEYSKSDFCDDDLTNSSCHNKFNVEDKPELAIKVSDSVCQASLKTRQNSADHTAVSPNFKLSYTDPLPNCIEILEETEPVKCMKSADGDVLERKNLTEKGSISSAVHGHSSHTTNQGIPVLLAENQMDSWHRSSKIDHVTSEGESHVSPETIKGLDLLNKKQENKTVDSLISKERQKLLVLGSPSRISPASWKHTEEDVSASMLNDNFSNQRGTLNFKSPTLDEYNLNMKSETKKVLDASQPVTDLQKMELKHVKNSLAAEETLLSPPKQSSSHDLCVSNEAENRSASSFVAHSYLDKSTYKELISNDYDFKETGKSEESQPVENKTIEVKPMKENKQTFPPSLHINEDLIGTCQIEEYNSLPVSSPEITLLKTFPSLEVNEQNVHSTLKGNNLESTSMEEKSSSESALQNIPVPPNVDYHEFSRSKEPTTLDASNITNLTAQASPSKLSSSFKITDSSLQESPKCTSAISVNEMSVLTDLTEDAMEIQRPYEALSNTNNKESDSDCNIICKPSLLNNMNDRSAKHEVLYDDAAQLESSNSIPSSDREVMCPLEETSNLRQQNSVTVLCSEKQCSSASKTYGGNLDKVHLEIQEKEVSHNIEHVVSNTEIDEKHFLSVSLSKVSESLRLGSSASLYIQQKVIPKNEERVNLEEEISIQSLTEVNQSELGTVEQSARAEPTFSSLREIKTMEDPKLSPKPFLHETGRLSVPLQFKFSKTFKTLGISQLCSTSEDSSDVESSKANASSSGVIRNTTASTSHTLRSSSKTSPVLPTTQQADNVGVEPSKFCSSSQDAITEPSQADHQSGQLSERDILHPDKQAADDSQTGSSTKHTFPHISNAVSKLGVKQRQYRSRSVAQNSRTPSVDRGHASRSRSKSRRRRSHSKSSSRKKRSESTARKKSSHSKSVRRKRSRSRSRGRKRRSQSKSKGKKKRSTSKLSGKRKRSKSKSSETIGGSKSLGKDRSSRSKSKTRKYRLQSKSPEKKGRSRSKSEARKNLPSKTASAKKRSRSKSPNWRRKSHSKSLSRSRSRSVSGSWKRFSNSKSSLHRKRSQSSSRSTSPTRRSRSRNKRRSFSRSPAARSNSRSRSWWQRSRSRGRWRRSRSLSASRHRSTSTSRLSSSLSTKKRKSLSPVRRRRSRSQIKQKDKSPVSKRKSTSPPPPPQKKSVQSKPAGFKHSIGLKSLIQKQLSQAKSQGSTGKLFKEQMPLPNVTSRTQLSMFSIRSQASVSSLSNIGQIPVPNLAEVPLPSESQVSMPNVPPADLLSVSSLAAETQLSVPDLTTAHQWHVPDMSSGAPWSMPDIAAGTQWSMADLGTGTHWPMSELTAGSHWPMHDLTGAQWSVPDLAAGTQWAVPDVASGAQWAVPDLAAGTQWTVPDLTAGSQWAMTNLAGGAPWAVPDLAATAHWTVPDLTAGAQIQRADLAQEAQVPGSDLALEAQVPGSDLAAEAQVPGSDLVAEAQVPGSDMVAEAELPPEHDLHPEEHHVMPDVAAEALVPVASSTLVPDVAAGILLPDVAAAAQMPVPDVAATIHMPDVATEAQKQMSDFVAAQVYMSLSPEESVEDSHFEEPIVASGPQTELDSCDGFVQQSSFEPSVNTSKNLQMEETLSSAQLPVDFENSQIAEFNEKTILLEKADLQLNQEPLTPDLQLNQVPVTPDLQLNQEPVKDLLSNLPQVEPDMVSECPPNSETCTPSNVPFATSESSDYSNIAMAVSSPVHSIPVESNPMQEHSLIDNSLQSEPHASYSNTFVESQSSPTKTGCVKPNDNHDQSLLAATNSTTDKLQVEHCHSSDHTLMEEASSKWDAPYASPEHNDDHDQPLSMTDNTLQVEPCHSSDHTLMEEPSSKWVAPYASPEPSDDHDQPLLVVTNSMTDNIQVEPCHDSDTLMEEQSSKWVAPYASPEPNDDHNQPLLAVTNSMTDNIQVEPCHSSDHTLMEEPSSKWVAPYASPEPNNNHNKPLLAVTNSITDNIQVEQRHSSDHTLMEEPSSKWVALYASPNNILQNEHPVNSNTTPEIGSQSISDFNKIKACIPDHSQKVELNPSSHLPQLTESYASLKQPQLVEPYASPDHPQLVEPYSSPVHPQLVEPYNSPQHPPLVEHYSSPDHPRLVEPYASPEFPQLVEPYASPDHQQLVEPYTDTEHAQICQPCMSSFTDESMTESICSPAEKPEVPSISGHTLSEATVTCTPINTDSSCSDSSERKNDFPTMHENSMTSEVPKNETIDSVYPQFSKLNDASISLQEVPCPSLLKAYSLESNFSPKESTSEESSPTERQSVETSTGSHLEHSTSPAQPLTKHLCSAYPIHEDEAFPISDEKPLNSCSSHEEPKLDSPCFPTNEQLLDEQFVTDDHSQSKELCSMKEVFQPHKDLISSEQVQENLYNVPVQTLDSFPSTSIPHTNEQSLNASHESLTEYEHLSAEDPMNHPDNNLAIPVIPNTFINLHGGGPPCTIMPLPEIPEQETNTEYSRSEESEAAPGCEFPDRLLVTQVDELLDKPSPSSEPVVLHDSQDKDTCCSSPSKELSDCPNTFLPEHSFNADHSTPSEYSTKINQSHDQTVKTDDSNTVFQSEELSLDRYVDNTLLTENASVSADLQFLNKYKLDCSASNQATDLSVECLKDKLENSSQCIKTDNHFTTTPPDLLPYDSDQPTDMCSEHSSEPVPFNSQPPPELLPYDSEQPANSFLSTSEYSTEQGSSDFHAPPELLPYDSDQPIVLHNQQTEPGGEELPVYDSTTIHQEPNKALDLPSMDSVESLNIHEIPEKIEPFNETDHPENNFVREVSSESSIEEFPSTEHTFTSETLQEHPVPYAVLDCSQEYPSSPWSSTGEHLTAQLAKHEQSVVQPVLGSESPEPLISMCEKQAEQTAPLTNISDHSEVQCSSSYELMNTSESEISRVLPLMQDEISLETAKESSSPKSLTNTECPQSPPTCSKTDPISELKSSHERSSSIERQKSRSKSASRNKRSRSKSVTRAKKSRSKSLVKSKSIKSRSASTESNRRSPVVKKNESAYVAHKRSSSSASVGRKRLSRSSSLSPRRRSPSVDRKSHRRRSHSQSRQRQSRSPSEFRRRSRSPSIANRRRSSSVARKRRSRSPSVTRKRRSPSVTRKKSSPPANRRRRSPSVTRRRRTPSPVIRRRRTPSPSAPRRRRSPSAPRRRRSRSPSAPRRRRSRSLSAPRRRRSPSPSAPRRRRSPSPPTTWRRRSPSPSATRRRCSPSPSATRRRRSPSTSEFRRKRSPSLSVSHKRQSHSPSIPRKRRSRSTSVSRRRRSRSASQRKRSRSPSAPRKRRSKSKSPSKSPVGKQSKSDRSRSLSQSKVSRKRKTRSRSSSREKKAVEKRRKRSSSKDSSKDYYSIKQRRKSRTPPRRKKSRSPARRASVCKSPVRRRRSRSPIRRKSFSRSPIRRKRSRSRDMSMDSARSPKRLTDLDKAQLLEIAKANAAAMCAKAGVPLSLSLKPVLTPAASGDEKITNRNYGSSIQELTEKCKQIAQSKEDDVIVNKPHDSDDEEEDRPFYNHPFKVSEHKPISFSLLNPSLKPAPKTQVTLTKEFPVSSGSQHRKKESDKVYGEWVPVDKNTEENKDDVFTNTAPAQF